MKSYLKLLAALAFFGFGSILSMEEWGKDEPVSEDQFDDNLGENLKSDIEHEVDFGKNQLGLQNEILYLDTYGAFPNELWPQILEHVFFDLVLITGSSNIYEAVKKIERLFATMSCICILFSSIKKQFKEESIKFYRVNLKDHFLEHKYIGIKKAGLYPKQIKLNIYGYDQCLDYKIGPFLLHGIDDGILPYVVGRIKKDVEYEKNVCLLLIFFGADVNAKDNRIKNTALIYAVEYHPKLVPMLCAKGADVNIVNQFNQNALDIASGATGDNEMVVKMLLDRGACIYVPSIYNACESGNAEILQLLLANKYNFNECEVWNKSESLLLVINNSFMPISEKRLKIIKILLEGNTDLNYKDLMGKTNLMHACKKGFIKIVELLLDKDVDVNVKDNFGETALMKACKKGYSSFDALERIAIAEMLLDKGADMNVKNNHGKTAIDLAEEKGNQEMIKFLKSYASQSKAQSESADSYCLVS